MSAVQKGSTAMRIPSFSASMADRAATLAAMGFGIVAGFQLLLALGAPWGRAAMGGPTKERSRQSFAS